MATKILGKVAITPKGEYSNATTYQNLDLITYQGNSYLALKETTGNLPTNNEYWQLIAEKGQDGEKGETGERGEKGQDGKNGQNGSDAYTVLLTNENHTFVANHLGVTAEQIVTTDVIAYKGSTPIKPTIGTLPSVTGLTLAQSGVRITIKTKANVSTLADSGSFDIPITVDGKSFTKSFSWTKVKDGQKGEDGQPGTNGTNGGKGDAGDRGPTIRGPIDYMEYGAHAGRRWCNGIYPDSNNINGTQDGDQYYIDIMDFEAMNLYGIKMADEILAQ